MNRDINGKFIKGFTYRDKKPYWNKEWLFNQYVKLEKSAKQIAIENDCKENNILYFIKKFGISTRSMSEIRNKKYWGLSGNKNPMYGRIKNDNPNWKGGITPKRQEFYAKQEWKNILKYIRKRDNYICNRCGIHKKGLHVHHIVSFMNEELRDNPNNLILLCKDCHNFVHSKNNINKEYIK